MDEVIGKEGGDSTKRKSERYSRGNREGMGGDNDNVIEILSDSETDEEDEQKRAAAKAKLQLPSATARSARPNNVNNTAPQPRQAPRTKQLPVAKKQPKYSSNGKVQQQSRRRRSLQAGLVLEEDLDDATMGNSSNNNSKNSNVASSSSLDTDSDEPVSLVTYVQQQEQRQANGQLPILYHDLEFESCPSSIEGGRRENKIEKCRCSPSEPVEMSYIQRGKNKGKPYYHCAKRGKKFGGQQDFKYFRWAFKAQSMHWYRFGNHTNHTIVQNKNSNNTGFSANDLIQGKSEEDKNLRPRVFFVIVVAKIRHPAHKIISILCLLFLSIFPIS